MVCLGLVEVIKCTEVIELDVSGCWQVTNRTLHALQESLLHMRGGHEQIMFSLTVGGK